VSPTPAIRIGKATFLDGMYRLPFESRNNSNIAAPSILATASVQID
jgi:hypothetical protein